LGATREDFLDFSANINPLGPPEDAILAAEKAIRGEAATYPDPRYPELRAALAAYLGVPPEIVLPTIRHFQDVYPQFTGRYCLRCSFNLTFANDIDGDAGWPSPSHFGINLGPVVLMCENYRSGLLWRLMRACPYVVTGLRRAGFTKGWL